MTNPTFCGVIGRFIHTILPWHIYESLRKPVQFEATIPGGAIMKSRAMQTVIVLLLASLYAYTQTPARHVNQERFWSTVEKLSEFGRPAGGGFDSGVTRIGFSEADLAARSWLGMRIATPRKNTISSP
jgi:hypothetical protein